MNRTLALSLCVLCCGFTALAAKTNTEDKAVREQVQKFVAAWNNHDAKVMAEFWAEDGTVINPVGRRADGRADIEKLLNDEHTTFMKTSTASMSVETIRWVRPDVGFADCTMELTGMRTPDGKELPVQKVHVSMLMAKKAKRWWWTDARPYHFQNPPAELATSKN